MMDARALTNLSASYQSPLFGLESCMTSRGFQELYEPVRLLDGDLGQFAIFVEDMEHVSLGHSFGRKIAWNEQKKSVGRS